MSIRSRTLPNSGNSAKLLAKFNRVRRATVAVTFCSNLAIVLDEMASLDLLWNSEIPAELESRRSVAIEARHARARLNAEGSRYVQLALSVDLLNRANLSTSLARFPPAQASILGAVDRLAVGGPDSERHALVSCRSAIENVCIALGVNGDWKLALKAVYPAESDQRAVNAVVNYLGAKIHGGHVPTRDEAEQGLRLTMGVITTLASRGATAPVREQ